MAEKATKPKGKAKAKDDAARKAAVLEAALVHAPFDGFTNTTLATAAKEAGIAPGDAARLFPDGALSLVEAFSADADEKMQALLAQKNLSSLKIRERITEAVLARIEVLRPRKEAARRAAAFLTLPPHAALGARLLYRTVDAMWRAAGDTATDFNFYTKRAILAGVYSATLMRWFTDQGTDEAATRAFLAARIEDVMRFEKFKAGVKKRTEGLPSLADIIGRFQRAR